MNAMQNKLLLNHSEAAEMLGIAPGTLTTLRNEGAIPFLRIRPGRKGIRYPVAQLQDWISNNLEGQR